eukprot:scaffold1425_cov162-Chaetoceros_neogracile.AAC.1
MRICCCTSWGWAGPPGAGQCRIACANVDDEVYAIQAGVQDAHLIYTTWYPGPALKRKVWQPSSEPPAAND